jgi:hypothetical protein
MWFLLFNIVPGPVADFKAQAFSSYIFANWGEPAEKNGILLGYAIAAVKHKVKEPHKPVNKVVFVDVEINQFEHLFKDVDPETRYVIYLQAKTIIGPGPVMKADVKTIKPAGKYLVALAMSWLYQTSTLFGTHIVVISCKHWHNIYSQ